MIRQITAYFESIANERYLNHGTLPSEYGYPLPIYYILSLLILHGETALTKAIKIDFALTIWSDPNIPDGFCRTPLCVSI